MPTDKRIDNLALTAADRLPTDARNGYCKRDNSEQEQDADKRFEMEICDADTLETKKIRRCNWKPVFGS